MDHLQPVTSTVQMVPVGSVSSIPTSVQSLKPNEQMRFHEPTAQYRARPQNVNMLNLAGYMMPKTNFSGVQQLDIQNNDSREMGPMFSNQRLHHVQNHVKREFPADNVTGYPVSPSFAMSNKKLRQIDNRPWLNTMSASSKNTSQLQSQTAAGVLASQQFVAPNKKTIQLHAALAKPFSQKASTPRSHPTQGQASLKAQNESNESVRSKLRESISAALALVTEKEKPSTIINDSPGATATTSELVQASSPGSEIAMSDMVADNSGEKPTKEATDDCSTPKETFIGNEMNTVAKNVCGSTLTDDCVGQELNVIDIDLLPDVEESLAGNFFGKDDLLQGNGLSWVLDFDAWVAEKEGSDGHDIKKQKKTNTPQSLALKIELELFKLFGGVNKKYKEKGRSLLFNLKDRNNPELREKVMSGEISPARLCSMTAEELASKELSEWRIAKAEEFEQMKILPDFDIDIRRLVRKTHKGEFQVEVEEDDVSVEVSVGSSSLPRIQTQAEETKAQSDGSQEELRNEKSSSEMQDEYTLTIPSNESTDLMQGLIEDELKDAEFLPPIVSLDEFMESLHSEPPFENLPEDAEKAEASLDNDHSNGPSETKSAKQSPDSQANATSMTHDDLDVKDQKPDTDADVDGDTKSVDSQSQTAVAVSKGQSLWEGSLQLSITSTIAVIGFFKSGEKAPTKEWPRTLEIKGRVRLDAFEKFLQDLYKSRSRSIMVMHVILKDPSKESEALSQVEDSYVKDERVGFAEPLRGVEVYLCPHHPKILDRVVKHLAKDQSEALALAGDEKGFIGVIVWRKAHVSPNSSSSHHKHSYKKHQQEHNTSSRRHNHQDRNIVNVNASSNLAPKYPVLPIVSSKTSEAAPMKVATMDDDLPPGFGPQASQDDDDLPEFNFSGGLNRLVVPTQKPAFSQSQNRPSDQMRQLIQEYGQTGANAGPGLVVKPWKDEDDEDDIPEWQPQVPLATAAQPTQVTQHNYQPLNQPMLQHLINQQQQRLGSPMHQTTQAAMPLQAPTLVILQNGGVPTWPQQQSGVWMNPQGPQQQGQYYGSQSRGF